MKSVVELAEEFYKRRTSIDIGVPNKDRVMQAFLAGYNAREGEVKEMLEMLKTIHETRGLHKHDLQDKVQSLITKIESNGK